MMSRPCNPVKQRVEALLAERDAAWKAYIALDAAAEDVVMRLYDLASGPGDETAAAEALAERDAKLAASHEALGRVTASTREVLCLLDGGWLTVRPA